MVVTMENRKGKKMDAAQKDLMTGIFEVLASPEKREAKHPITASEVWKRMEAVRTHERDVLVPLIKKLHREYLSPISDKVCVNEMLEEQSNLSWYLDTAVGGDFNLSKQLAG